MERASRVAAEVEEELEGKVFVHHEEFMDRATDGIDRTRHIHRQTKPERQVQ